MKKPCYSLGFEEFSRLATQGNLVPIYREILADLETPVSACGFRDPGLGFFQDQHGGRSLPF